MTANSPAERARTAAVPRNNRSAVSNGSRVANGIDLRSREGRRWRDLVLHYLSETGGRHDALCKQAASLIIQRERLDSMLARGEPVDTLDLVRLCGAINRTLARLGLDEPEPYDGTDDAPPWVVRSKRPEAAAP